MAELQGSRQSAFGWALAELSAGRVETAQVLCDRILDSTPQDPAAHQLAATIALQRGRLDDAARWASSSLSLRPDHAPTLIMAARVARRAGDLAHAKDGWTAPAASPPIGRSPPFWLALRSSSPGDEKARSVLEDLLIRFPNFVEGWREIGEALHKAGHPKTALLAFARAADLPRILWTTRGWARRC